MSLRTPDATRRARERSVVDTREGHPRAGEVVTATGPR